MRVIEEKGRVRRVDRPIGMVKQIEYQALPPQAALPLTDYALLGDGHSAALVSSQGGIDFWCPSRFDGDSVFLRLLDPGGGAFATAPAASHRVEVSYLPLTNIHRAALKTATGRVISTTFMSHSEAGHERDARRILRLVECEGGRVDITVDFEPRFHYGSAAAKLTSLEGGVVAEGPEGFFTLRSNLPIPLSGRACRATFGLEPDERIAFILEYGPRIPPAPRDVLAEASAVLEREMDFWRNWIGRCHYDGPYREEVLRSLLALKLLQYSPAGSFVAAPTFGLPEREGGHGNWDYRFTWLRDSAFIVMAFETMGFKEEALRFRRWLAALVKRESADRLRPLYRVDGSPAPRERELSHLRGYRGSLPVRIGNAAAEQRQLDTYGNVMICFHRAPVLWREEGRKLWEALAALTDYALEHWQEAGAGIWEFRERRQWTYSKGMVWLALERALEIAKKQGFEAREEWKRGKQQIETWLEGPARDERGAFRQMPEEKVVDSASLLFPLFGITSQDDMRIPATFKAMEQDLVSHGLAFRYLLPGRQESEGAFLAINFGMAWVSVKLGRIKEARRYFDSAAGIASVLGLLPEEADPVTKTALGNYPLGLSHYSLILAAYALDQAEKQQ